MNSVQTPSVDLPVPSVDPSVDLSEADYGEHLIWRLVGSKIVMFGANANGEIFLVTQRDGKNTELVIGKDEKGEISLFEIEKTTIGVAP